MNANQHDHAEDIGYNAAADYITSSPGVTVLTRDDVDEASFPEAFSHALDMLPECEALDISEAVHVGIAAAFEDS